MKETLPQNISDNADYPNVEFVVLDYNSKDGLDDWMCGFLKANPVANQVAYYRERSAKFFDPRNAKNAAHLLASGDVVVNIDADNFTGPGYASALAAVFATTDKLFVTAKTAIRSMCGKIAFRKEDFIALRGYDEIFRGWGWEDPDLTQRAVAAGFREIKMQCVGARVIDHSNEERTINLEDKTPVESSSRFNRRRTTSRVPGSIVNPRGFGRISVYVGFSDVVRSAGSA